MKRDFLIQQLTNAFAPTILEVRDVSAAHTNHPGVPPGALETHWQVQIQSPLLKGKSRLEQHRLIYESLGKPLEALGIHALSIEVLA